MKTFFMNLKLPPCLGEDSAGGIQAFRRVQRKGVPSANAETRLCCLGVDGEGEAPHITSVSGGGPLGSRRGSGRENGGWSHC